MALGGRSATEPPHYAPSAHEVAMVNEAFAMETSTALVVDRHDRQRRLPGL
jgi:hypothetical protein